MAPSEENQRPSVSFANVQSATWPMTEKKAASLSNGLSNGNVVNGPNGVQPGLPDSGLGDSTRNVTNLTSPTMKSPTMKSPGGYSNVGDEDDIKDQSHRIRSWGPHQVASSGPQSRARAKIHT
jgi:hypothetical protein